MVFMRFPVFQFLQSYNNIYSILVYFIGIYGRLAEYFIYLFFVKGQSR